MTAASLNFTQRRKIKSTFVDIRILERTEAFIRVRVAADAKVLNSAEDYRLVLDGFDRGRHQRHTISNPAGDDLDFTGFPSDASLRFKVRQVARGADEGRVIAATADIRPVEIEGKVQREPFIKPDLDDLGALPWCIQWDEDVADPRLVLNRRLEDQFGTWKNPVLQALYLPAMLRELLTGLICRVESEDELDDGTLGGRIITFCKERFDAEIPLGAFNGSEGNTDEWLRWADECVVAFAETKWRKGKTLFDLMLEETK
ncbi:MAG: hypothetical protein CL575_10940 [Altererythrobacter sp.]|nr:hypothetical protein [Altererythrobacter sp.]MBK63433.1 hypothetical protein [Altererythrobacter sp.]|tara:strand:- start:10545 stop:11321 length:777 start_codon:yes stop_codon:yes gene_type:complete